MIRLEEINEDNWCEVAKLRTTEEQKKYVASAIGILARGYVMRESRAKVYAITEDDTYVGIAMIRDIDDDPECYELQQFFIDYKYQGHGYGKQALKLIISELNRERKYANIEVCVKMEDSIAIHIYKSLGFVDTKYISPEVPDAYNLRYVLYKDNE